jgi:hypothetical protein
MPHHETFTPNFTIVPALATLSKSSANHATYRIPSRTNLRFLPPAIPFETVNFVPNPIPLATDGPT